VFLLFVYISIALKIKLSREGRNPIYCLTFPFFVCLSQPRAWRMAKYFYCSCLEASDSCSFCRYWWTSWLSLSTSCLHSIVTEIHFSTELFRMLICETGITSAMVKCIVAKAGKSINMQTIFITHRQL